MSDPAPAGTSADMPNGTNQVEMTLPLRTDFVATLRTVAASLGADAGFSIDEIDDLRLAISEVVSSMIDSTTSNADRIVATFDLDASRIAVGITTLRGELQIELDDLASSILQSVVDEYEVVGAHLTLVKLASEAVGFTETETETGAEAERSVHGA